MVCLICCVALIVVNNLGEKNHLSNHNISFWHWRILAIVCKSRDTQLFVVLKVVYHKYYNLSCIEYSWIDCKSLQKFCSFVPPSIFQTWWYFLIIYYSHTRNCQVPCLTDYDYFNCCWSVSSRAGQSQLVTWPLPLPLSLLPPHAHNAMYNCISAGVSGSLQINTWLSQPGILRFKNLPISVLCW